MKIEIIESSWIVKTMNLLTMSMTVRVQVLERKEFYQRKAFQKWFKKSYLAVGEFSRMGLETTSKCDRNQRTSNFLPSRA
jgi:hypothetical protein